MQTQLLQPNLASLQGKYLTFRLDRQTYGVSVLKVREIIRMITVTPLPQMPPDIAGVVNLRGKIVPVVDTKVKFGMGTKDTSDRTCIVVVRPRDSRGRESQIGMIVDDVEEVAQVAERDIEETPEYCAHFGADYLLGVAKIKDRVIVLLDLDKALAREVLVADAVASSPNLTSV